MTDINPHEQLNSPLKDLLPNAVLGKEVLSYIRLGDLVRLACVDRSLKSWVYKIHDYEETLICSVMMDLEVLLAMKCKPALLSKMEKAYQNPKGFRIVLVDEEDDFREQDMCSVDEAFVWSHLSLFGTQSFEDLSENWCQWAKQNNFMQWEKEEGRGCTYMGCTRTPMQTFMVNNKPICGHCMDSDLLIRLQFGHEHNLGYNCSSRWGVFEEDCQEENENYKSSEEDCQEENEDDEHSYFRLTDNESAMTQLKSCEFSVHLWTYNARHRGHKSLWFVGRGERHPQVSYLSPWH